MPVPPYAVRVRTSSGWQDIAIQGPPGASLATYVHTQGTASATWTIAHNLGRFPCVSLLDSVKQEIEGQVDHVDVNNLTVSFSGPVSGTALLGG